MNEAWTADHPRVAERIVSLLPSATEILYALGLEERVVGVTHECDYPERARAKPHLTASALPSAADSAEIDRHVRASLHAGSSLYALDADLLASLAPDLIVTQELCEVCAVSYDIVARAAKRLRGDPRLISLEPSSLDDVYANVATLGELTGRAPAATALVASLRDRAARLGAHVAGRPRPRALVLEWTDPPMSGGHWTPGLVELAGGEPILSHPGENSRVVAWDAIVAADPDVVLVAPCGFGMPAVLGAIADLERVPAWRSLRAYASGHVFAIDGNAYVNRPGTASRRHRRNLRERSARRIVRSGPRRRERAAPVRKRSGECGPALVRDLRPEIEVGILGFEALLRFDDGAPRGGGVLPPLRARRFPFERLVRLEEMREGPQRMREDLRLRVDVVIGGLADGNGEDLVVGFAVVDHL